MATVAIVNDDPIQRHLLATLLEQDGVTVRLCDGAEAVLRLLEERGPVDALVLDLHMPEINGWQLCRFLRSPEYPLGNAIPILVVSATHSGSTVEQITMELGADAFLAWPVPPDEFRRCVHRLIQGFRASAAPRVLLVERDHAHARILQQAWGTYGWQVELAQSASEALRMLHRSVPDIGFIEDDPADHDTLEVIREIKQRSSTAIVVVMMARVDHHRVMQTLQYGVDGYVSKFLSPDGLVARCEQMRRERAVLQVEDLLEQRTAALRESETRFRVMFEEFPDVIVVWDHSETIRYFNRSGARRLHWDAQELIGQSVRSIEPSWLSPSKAETTSPRVRTTVFVSRMGESLDVEVTEQPIRFNGEMMTLAVARDIRERKQAERERAQLEHQLRQAMKMEAIGRLAGGIAHDINNLLTAILGHASLLSAEQQDFHSIVRSAEIIAQAARRGRELTAQLLGFARQGKQRHVAFDLHATIHEVLTLLARTKAKAFVIKEQLDAACHWVEGDPDQIHQVILNVALNACDAMSQQGILTVSTTNESVGESACQEYPGLYPNDYVVITVQDTGCGIPPDVLPKIFEPFFTTKEVGRGSGMGLAMTYGIVKNHGGYIAVSSEVGQGTQVRIYLPYTRARREEEPSSNISPAVSGEGRILIVDDEELVGETARELLESLGYDVLVVHSGAEAIALYQLRHREIDLVLLDHILADMDGQECFRRLRECNPSAIVLLSSGYLRNESVQALLKEGIAGFIQKPYDVHELSQAVARVLRRPSDHLTEQSVEREPVLTEPCP
ncbi:MAG: response regulator [Nitrospirae bacterium]|nr:MAG: response regulator [Nitrospirota bacterium]